MRLMQMTPRHAFGNRCNVYVYVPCYGQHWYDCRYYACNRRTAAIFELWRQLADDEPDVGGDFVEY